MAKSAIDSANDELATGELFIEHREEAIDARMRVGDDTGIIARLLEHFRLDEQLPDKGVDGGLRTAAPPEQPLIDLGRLLGVGAGQLTFRMLGGEIFEDRRRLPQHEVVIDEGRHLAVRVLGEVIRRAGFSNARIAADAIQRNAKLGRE